MKKILSSIVVILLVASCQITAAQKEMEKTGKSAAASGRINATEGNTKDVFKELDE